MKTLLPEIDSYWYLGSPYAKYPGGREKAYQEACKAAAELILAGYKIFCPIAHSHPIAELGGIDPGRHDIWLPVDKPMMNAAGGLIVLMMESWQNSKGLLYEIECFSMQGKHIHYMEWKDSP